MKLSAIGLIAALLIPALSLGASNLESDSSAVVRFKEKLPSPGDRPIIDFLAPTEEEYSGYLSQLKKLGLKIELQSRTHLWVAVAGEAAAFRKIKNLPELNSKLNGIEYISNNQMKQLARSNRQALNSND